MSGYSLSDRHVFTRVCLLLCVFKFFCIKELKSKTTTTKSHSDTIQNGNESIRLLRYLDTEMGRKKC
jgi:hypothetical protein